MGARVICMASAKGGSGKTILTATFGTFLAALGKKVLIIDTDGATNGLTLFYLKEVMVQGEYAIGKKKEPLGIYECSNPTLEPEKIKLATGVDLIPATYKFQNTENEDLIKFKACLKERLMHLRSLYDYIFLDAQAGSDLCAQAAMSSDVSDEVVIVSEYDPVSAAGVERLKALLREDLTYPRTWVLLNKMLPDFVQSFSDFLEIARYLSPIPWDADVVRAYARRRLAIDLDYGNEHTLAVSNTLKAMLGDEIFTDLETWAEAKAAVIRQPIEDQYQDTVNEFDELMREKYVLDRRATLLKYMTAFTFGLLALGGLFFILKLSEAGMGLYKPVIYFIMLVLAVAMASILHDIFANKLLRKSGESRRYAERALLQHRLDMLLERMKKLEVLKNSDVDTLVKLHSKPQQP